MNAIEKAKEALGKVSRIIDVLELFSPGNAEKGSVAESVREALAALEAEKPTEDMGEWGALSKKEMWETIQEIRVLVDSDGTKTILSDIEDFAEAYHSRECAKCKALTSE